MRHSQITEQIWCGGELGPGDWEALYAQGVRVDLSLQEEKRDDFGGLSPEAELWLPATDWYMPSLDQLLLATQFISSAVALGKKIVVHCKLGVGRAPLTVACYLVTQGLRTRDALEYMRERRPLVEPNRGQVQVVEEFEDLYQSVREALPRVIGGSQPPQE
ncbi:dual specificity protein phosphatase family protein [bacterium]|nr:dual specificity protein phosphatase family protein [bacterium]